MRIKHLALLLASTALMAASAADSLAQNVRVHHSATLLPSGDILIAGGRNTAGAFLSSADLWFSTRGVWTPRTAASMTIPRSSHTATLLPDGRVLVAGGLQAAGGPVQNSAEIYNPRTNAWSAAANNMTSARFGHTATLLPNGMVLLAGGQSGVGGTLTDTCDLFNPSDNKFYRTGDLALARTAHTATLLYNGKVFVAGGSLINGFTVSTELYDHLTGIWNPGPSLNMRRAFHSATALGNRKVLISGGFNGQNYKECYGFLETTEIYDPVAESISPGTAMQERKIYHASILQPDGSLNISGGLGNITTSYFTPSLTFDEPSTLSLMANPRTPLGWIYGPLSSLWLPITANLSVAANGDVVDGDVWFSSPTATLTDAKVYFSTGITRASINGQLIEDGVLNPYGVDIEMTSPSGKVIFFPRDATADDMVLTGGSLSFPSPLVPGATANITGGSLNGTLVVQFPESDKYGTILWGRARITGGSITDSVAGYSAALSSGGADITGGTFTYDDTVGWQLIMAVSFTGVKGTITNSTSTNITSPRPVSGLSISGLEVNLSYVVSPLDLTGATFSSDIATVTIRKMVFADVEAYSPDENSWSFNHTVATAFDQVGVLTPNGDQVFLGGLACQGAFCPGFQAIFAPSSALIPVPKDPVPWTGLNDAIVARSNHTVTPLPDGQLLMAGGTDGINSLASAELMDPVSSTWSLTGPMGVPRDLHTATLLPNGTVLAAGGFVTGESTGATKACEIFYPRTGTWVPTSPMISSRNYHSAVLLPDGNVLVAGGFDANGNYLSSAEIFISTAHRWVQIASMNNARAQHSMTLLQNGTVVVVGGVNTGILGSVEAYNPARGGGWTSLASLNTPRYSHTATQLIDGRLLAVGGTDGFRETGSAEIFDPVRNAWDRTTSLGGNDMLVPRLGHNATLMPNGKILITGGMTSAGTPLSLCEGFDLQFSTWQEQGNLKNARGFHATVLTREGNLLAIGGRSAKKQIQAVESYFFMGEPDLLSPKPSLRLPNSVDTDTGTFNRGATISIRGQRLKGATEASAGRGASNSSFHHPRVYLQRLDSSANSTQNSSGFLLDLTTRVYLSGGPNDWSKMDSSITLTVPNSFAQLPFGWYHLRVAANAQFSEPKSVQVGPPLPSGTPGTPGGTVLGVSSVAWTWQAAPGSFDGYNVYSATSGIFLGTTSANSFIQRSLGPDTVASVKVAAYNISGDGPVSVSSISIPTQSGYVATPVAVASTTASISWSWARNSAALSYNILSSTSADRIANVDSPSIMLTGLSTNTPYGIAVQAVTESGTGQLSAMTTAFTLAATPVPSSPPFDHVSTGSFLAHWLPASNPSGTVYQLAGVLEDGTTAAMTVSSDSADTTSLGVSGVPPNTFFTLYIAAVNGDGIESAYALLGTSSTLAVEPSSLRATYTDTSRIAIAWDSNGNSTSTLYQVLVSTTYMTGVPPQDRFVQNCSTPIAFSQGYKNLEATLTGLLTGKDYFIRVMARNHYGNETPYVSTNAFTDNGGAPPGSFSFLAAREQFTEISGSVGSGRTVALRIPPKTFEGDVRLTLSSETIASGHPCRSGSLDAGITIAASPQLQPQAPFQITLYYSASDSVGNPATLGFVRYDPASRACVPLQSSVDQTARLVTAEVNHLSTFLLTQLAPASSMAGARVFPNPLYSSSQGYFTFDRLPGGSRVRVFTLHGEEAFEGTANASGVLIWKAVNKAGRSVASGLYLAVIESGGDKKIMKLAVVR
jgi:N-acetylneuraminic acid mutarotase